MTRMSDGTPATPDLDDRIIADLRDYRADTTKDALHLTLDEIDALLRAVDERDELRVLVASLRAGGLTPTNVTVLRRSCPGCEHEPHGVGLICPTLRCGCRG